MEAVKIITLPPTENPASAAPLSTSAASRRNNAEIKCGAPAMNHPCQQRVYRRTLFTALGGVQGDNHPTIDEAW